MIQFEGNSFSKITNIKAPRQDTTNLLEILDTTKPLRREDTSYNTPNHDFEHDVLPQDFEHDDIDILPHKHEVKSKADDNIKENDDDLPPWHPDRAEHQIAETDKKKTKSKKQIAEADKKKTKNNKQEVKYPNYSKLINKGGRFVGYNPRLGLKIGTEAALYFAQLVYLHEYWTNKAELTDGMFYVTCKNLQKTFSWSYKKQCGIIDTLKAHKLIEFETKDAPQLGSRWYFKVNINEMNELMGIRV